MLTGAEGFAEAFLLVLASTGQPESSFFLPLHFGAAFNGSLAITKTVLAVGGSSECFILLR